MKKRENYVLKSLRAGIFSFLVAGMVACGGENRVADNEVIEDREDMAETETVGVNNWDNNQFNTRFASNNRYKTWDKNGDGFMDENEYGTGFYDTWDVNNDNRLEENEWNTASRDWGMENEKWGDWDTSGDGALDENEFRNRFTNTGWYKNWDTDRDNRINESEYSTGIFGQWDRNRDNMLDENENRYYDTYYGD